MNFLLTGFDCGGAAVLRVIKFVWALLDIVFILMPIGLLVYVTIDFVKNVMAGKEEDMKKNLSLVIKRFIFCVALFLVPMIVQTVINMLGEAEVSYAECIEIARTEDLSQYETPNEKESYNKETPNYSNENGNLSLSGNNSNKDDSKDQEPSKGNQASSGQGLWVAHQKNNPEKVDTAIKEGFWGIEVDVHLNNNVFQLYHDSKNEPYAGYDLDEFLETCKKNNITAVLDLKSVNNYDALISLVKEKGMQNNTIYQTGTGTAQKIHNIDNNARIWILISDSYEDINTQKVDELKKAKDYIEGINMRADHVDENDIKKIHDLGLTFCSFSYTKTLYKNANAETLKSWGTNYLMANSIDE